MAEEEQSAEKRGPASNRVARQLRAVPNWSGRIPALDGLRGIAILLVLLCHSVFETHTNSKFLNNIVAAGQLTWSGVDLFFVLSGFLIGGILLDARESPRYFQTFYVRRAYRILPLYFIVTALFLVRHLPFRMMPGHFGDVSPLAIPWWSYVTLTQNFWMAQLGWYGAMAMAVTWSLAVEEQFYLTIPLLVRLIRPQRLLYVLLSVVAGAPVLRALIRHLLPHGDYACYILMPCRADALCLGVLSALLVRSGRGWTLLLEKRKLLYGIAAVLFAGIAFMTYQSYGQFSAPMTTFGYSVLALFYTACLLLAVSTSRGWRMLRNRMLMGLGGLAYCTYLIHFPLIMAGRRLVELRLSHEEARLPGALLGIAVTLPIAMLSWKYFEKPLLHRGHKYVY
ncbi:MAG: acyltransferase family protein [Terriglobales bacterium]